MVFLPWTRSDPNCVGRRGRRIERGGGQVPGRDSAPPRNSAPPPPLPAPFSSSSSLSPPTLLRSENSMIPSFHSSPMVKMVIWLSGSSAVRLGTRRDDLIVVHGSGCGVGGGVTGNGELPLLGLLWDSGTWWWRRRLLWRIDGFDLLWIWIFWRSTNQCVKRACVNSIYKIFSFRHWITFANIFLDRNRTDAALNGMNPAGRHAMLSCILWSDGLAWHRSNRWPSFDSPKTVPDPELVQAERTGRNFYISIFYHFKFDFF